MYLSLKPFGAEARIFQVNWVNTKAADALVSCVTKPIATMISTGLQWIKGHLFFFTWKDLICSIQVLRNDRKSKYFSMLHKNKFSMTRVNMISLLFCPTCTPLCLPGLCWQTMCLAAWLQGCPPGHCLSTPSAGHPQWPELGRSMPGWLIHWGSPGPVSHLQDQHWITAEPQDDPWLKKKKKKKTNTIPFVLITVKIIYQENSSLPSPEIHLLKKNFV